MVTRFRHSLVLTYALPAEKLERLIPAGLTLDTYGDVGFVAIAVVQTEHLRPVGAPAWIGQNYFLSGYRVFARHRDPTGRQRRGLYILRSDSNRRSMVWGGNALTHYNYRLAQVAFTERPDRLHVEIRTPGAEADLQVVADLSSIPADLPSGSPFARPTDARRFAGPLPWTFDHERQTDSIVMIHARRSRWRPHPVAVEVKTCTFLERPPFAGVDSRLAHAFHVADVDYRWERGVRVAISEPREPNRAVAP